MKPQHYKKLNYGIWLLYVLSFIGCGGASETSLFHIVSSSQSNILFNNEVTETDSFNILSHEFMYNGGGVGVGDFNGDGYFDLYFTGNEVSNQLYLNKGKNGPDDAGFAFEDVTDQAGVGAPDIWSSGVSVIDINNDSRPDIYISATFRKDKSKRTNKLYINQGVGANGIPTFTEEGAAYGLADTSYTTQTYFFDYDNDGDLDAFLLNDKLFRPRSTTDLKLLMAGGEATIDKLLENRGNNQFVDVSQTAGITYPGFGLGAAILDVNADGFKDIYVSNDFISSDLLYVNQGDGTFKNEIGEYFKHHSFASMGIDVSDLNGDGIPEVMTLDMLPEDRARVKRTYAFQKYQFYNLMEETGYATQYNRNMLQLSNPSGLYSDISELAGVDATEWSWSILFADFDNDALKDIAITNGYPRDITDMDFADYNTGVQSMMSTRADLLTQIPTVKAHNYIFRNKGRLEFVDQSDEWGFKELTFSNGAAIVDLDNDGDLDYVTNNINDIALVYENKTSTFTDHNFLRINLVGENTNREAIGAQVMVYHSGKCHTEVNFHQRGYLSSVEPVMHFGLGLSASIDSVVVIWPNLSKTIMYNVAPNQVLTIEKDKKISQTHSILADLNGDHLFNKSEINGLTYTHNEIVFFDYRFQGLLPRLHSREGPGIAVGDLNGDHLEDLIISGGSRQNTNVFMSSKDDDFIKTELSDISLSEDMGVLIFDADGDKDNDVYVVSGSTEFRNGSGYYNDKYYENDGKGALSHMPEILPEFPSSGSSVTAADYDQDGDLDLFVAGRIEPQSYPLAPDSYLLTNLDGTFVISSDVQSMAGLGMVTQGLWTDIDNDGWMDLIVIGEWMSIKIFFNKSGQLNSPIEIPNSSGWWNSITGADLDGDGDIDYVLGNQGLNNKLRPSQEYPVIIYAHDFDSNGSIDPIITEHHQDGYYPVHLKMDLLNQLSHLKKNYSKYATYAAASIDQMIPADTLKIATKYYAETFESAVLWNDAGHLRLESLPIEAQFAPIYGSLCLDIDLDGDEDILLVGNRYSTEVFEGRHDALNGVFLKNDGSGNFKSVPLAESGFNVAGDARSLVQTYDIHGQPYVIASINNDHLTSFSLAREEGIITVEPQSDDVRCIITYTNGKKVAKEFYWGSSFLSQSSRKFQIDPTIVKEIDYHKSSGQIRKVTYR